KPIPRPPPAVVEVRETSRRHERIRDLAGLKKRAAMMSELRIDQHGVSAPVPIEILEMLVAALLDDLKRAGAPPAEVERLETVLRDLNKINVATVDETERGRLRIQAEATLRGFARRP